MEDQNKEKDEYEKICFMCRRPESKAGKMISLPNHICVCQDCMQKAVDMMQSSGFPFPSRDTMNSVQ